MENGNVIYNGILQNGEWNVIYNGIITEWRMECNI